MHSVETDDGAICEPSWARDDMFKGRREEGEDRATEFEFCKEVLMGGVGSKTKLKL